MPNQSTPQDLQKEIERLETLLSEKEQRLQEAQETLDAIRTGAVDGIVRSTPEGEQVFILKGSDQPYRNLVEKMNEGALLLSCSGTILYCNSGFAQLVASPLDKIMGTNIADWVSAHNIGTLNEIILGNIANGQRVFEIAIQNSKHQLLPTQVSISKISLDSIDALALIFTDLSRHMGDDIKRYTANLEFEVASRKRAEDALRQRTDQLEITQKKLEENAIQLQEFANRMEELANQRANQLRNAERLSAIGQTAGMVGHDIRNPLQAIVSELYLMKEELIDLPQSKEKQDILASVTFVEEQIEYINKIVADLQDYAKTLKPEIKETDLPQVVAGVFQTIKVPENIKVTIDTKNLPVVETDPTFLKRALTNLVNNAIQAMPNGGTLSVRAFFQIDGLYISVSDTGLGVPEEIKTKLFTPMVTTKSKGQGFGLAVVKRLIEALNGSITFESEKGKGTSFNIHLPGKATS